MKKLIWNTKKNSKSFWGEYHYNASSNWIFYLLEKIKYEILEDLNQIKKSDEIIIVDSELNSKTSFYYDLSNKCSKIFLIHLGDEGGKEKTDLIYECCSHVWRTFCLGYFFNNNKATCIPIGYKGGLTVNKKKILEKKYLWSFIGTPHASSRYDLILQNKKIEPNYIKFTSKFNSKDSLKINEYSDVINNSKFLLCPNGYFHPETYRLYEALECGSIPIVENLYNYYDRFFPNNPLLKIKFWKEAKEIILSMNDDKKKLIEQSNICNNWWLDIKKKYQENFKLVIDDG